MPFGIRDLRTSIGKPQQSDHNEHAADRNNRRAAVRSFHDEGSTQPANDENDPDNDIQNAPHGLDGIGGMGRLHTYCRIRDSPKHVLSELDLYHHAR
jgi:hypothetical protein